MSEDNWTVVGIIALYAVGVLLGFAWCVVLPAIGLLHVCGMLK